MLERKNNSLSNELDSLKKSTTISLDKGVSFLENKNARLLEELEALQKKKTKPRQASRKSIAVWPTIKEEMTKNTLVD